MPATGLKPYDLNKYKLCDVAHGGQDNYADRGASLIACPGTRPVDQMAAQVERDMLPLDRMGMAEGIYFAGATGAMISSSSTSNTSVAPGLIVGGAPLSPYARVEGQTNLFLLPTFIC